MRAGAVWDHVFERPPQNRIFAVCRIGEDFRLRYFGQIFGVVQDVERFQVEPKHGGETLHASGDVNRLPFAVVEGKLFLSLVGRLIQS